MSQESIELLFCTSCQVELRTSEVRPDGTRMATCTACGSVAYGVALTATATASFGLQVKARAKEKWSRRKTHFFEGKYVEEVDRDSGRMTRRWIATFRRGNRYIETVEYMDTGKLKVNKDEELAEHINRGSAKEKTKEAEGE